MGSDAVMVFKDAGVLYALTNGWTASAYQQRNPTADDFCTDLTTMRQWHDDLKRARNQVRGRVGCGWAVCDTHLLVRVAATHTPPTMQ